MEVARYHKVLDGTMWNVTFSKGGKSKANGRKCGTHADRLLANKVTSFDLDWQQT